MVVCNLMVDVRTVTYNRRLRKVNEMMVNDYIDYLDDTFGTGQTPSAPNLSDKYKETISALILGMFSVAFQANSSVEYQQQVYSLAEQKADQYISDVHSIFGNAYERVSDVKVEPTAYQELRDKNASILEVLNVKDAEHGKPYTEISPLIIRNSFNDRVALTQSLADYTYFTNVLDLNGNPLYNYKYWIWSQAEDTRHSEMDGELVEIDEYFTVINEVTGEEDLGLYPRDSGMSPSNAYNCLCDIGYLTDLNQ